MRSPTILRYVSILYRYSQIHMARTLRSRGTGAGPYPFLLAVNRLPGISQDGLSEELAIDKGATARAVRSLEEAGYLERRPDGRDRRTHRLYATSEGLALVEVLNAALRDWMDVLFRGLSGTERDQAFDLIIRMSGNARDFLAPVRASSPP